MWHTRGHFLINSINFQYRGRVGAGEGCEACEARGDRVAAGAHQGAAVRAVLHLLPQEPRAAPAAPAARPQLHLLPPPQQPPRQEGTEKRMQRGQHADAVRRRRQQGGSERRQEEEDGEKIRRELFLAMRPIS